MIGSRTTSSVSNQPKPKGHMKKTLLTAALIAASMAAFAQGKLGIVNDAAHPFILGCEFRGILYPTTPLPGGLEFSVYFYGGTGTTGDNLTLQTTFPLSMLTPGIMGTKALTMNGTYPGSVAVPGGVPGTFWLVVSETGDPTPGDYNLDGSSRLWGASSRFVCTPGASITYPSILPGGPTASTWAAEEIWIDCIPEPSAAALAGLGAGLLALRRRRARK